MNTGDGENAGRNKLSPFQRQKNHASRAKKTHQRLNALIKCENGFELAEKDLKIRGPGEVYGIRQSGMPDLAMASLSDIKLISETRKAAKEIFEKDPLLKNYPRLKERLKEFARNIHLE